MRELIGRTLGHYRILSRIGKGGMGEVYRAHDQRLDRDVAIKVLPEDVASEPQRLARFEQEAKTIARLEHPNILAIHDFATEDDVTYAVTELLEGHTLREYVSARGMGRQKAVEIGAAVAGGLAAAHEKGIIHRDIKPENIFVTSDGRVKILDFGLVRLALPVDEETPTMSRHPMFTEPGIVLGTAGYMSPEQVRGEKLDARSDIFSLGCVMYEMLSGHRPFRGDSAAERVTALLRDDPPMLGGIEPRVAELVKRALQKEPALRFQSASEIKTALEACLTQPVVRQGPSVAVLPFLNMSGTKKDDYLCEGLAEEIINVLTRIPGLRVIARTSSFAVSRMGLDVREVGNRLDVGSVLEGSVRRAGRRVRVTAQLIDTTDGCHLWSDRFDRELTDVLLLEDEIAQAIAERLRVQLRQDKADRQPRQVDIKAHSFYIEGRHFFAKGTPEALEKARDCFDRAIECDPEFALALDSLAELYWYLGLFGILPPREAFSQGTWHALHALEIDDTLADTHALLGMFRKELDYNWLEVDREMRRARELNPRSPMVRLRYAISGLLPHGRHTEAVAEIEAMIQDDPLSVFARWWIAIMAYLTRAFERMANEGRHMIALDATRFFGHWALGMARLECGSFDQGIASLRKAHELSGGMPFTLAFLAYAYGRAGCSDDACRLMEEARMIAAKTYVPPSTFALAYVGLDDWDNAFHWWNQAIDLRDPVIIPIKSLPFFDPVRNDPRFHAMLRDMNLAED